MIYVCTGIYRVIKGWNSLLFLHRNTSSYHYRHRNGDVVVATGSSMLLLCATVLAPVLQKVTRKLSTATHPLGVCGRRPTTFGPPSNLCIPVRTHIYVDSWFHPQLSYTYTSYIIHWRSRLLSESEGRSTVRWYNVSHPKDRDFPVVHLVDDECGGWVECSPSLCRDTYRWIYSWMWKRIDVLPKRCAVTLAILVWHQAWSDFWFVLVCWWFSGWWNIARITATPIVSWPYTCLYEWSMHNDKEGTSFVQERFVSFDDTKRWVCRWDEKRKLNVVLSLDVLLCTWHFHAASYQLLLKWPLSASQPTYFLK